jgi:hypothetical protein
MTKGWQATLYTTEMEHSGHERDGHRMGAHTVACDAASGVGSAEEGRTRWLDHGARRSRRRWRYRESGIEWALTILAVRSECLSPTTREHRTIFRVAAPEPVVDRGRPPRHGPRSLERAVEQRRSRIQPSTSRRARSAYAAASDLSSGCLPDRLLVPSQYLRALLIGPNAVDDEAPRNPTPMRSIATHLPAPTSEACSRHIPPVLVQDLDPRP